MSKNQTVHTKEFRRETIRLLESSGKSVPELAREMGVNEKSLYRWRSQFGTFDGSSIAATQVALEAEIKRLRRELKTVEQERDILKKAISIFSRSQS